MSFGNGVTTFGRGGDGKRRMGTALKQGFCGGNKGQDISQRAMEPNEATRGLPDRIEAKTLPKPAWLAVEKRNGLTQGKMR